MTRENLKTCIINNKNNYLNEKLLGIYLKYIFYSHEIVCNRVVPNSEIKNRPDFRIDSLKLIVEFDGYMHYNCTKTILKDNRTTKIWGELGYEVIRLPYFIQMNNQTLNIFYNILGENIDVDILSNYKLGFIDCKALRVKDFCLYGLFRFIEYLKGLDNDSVNEICGTLDDIDKSILDIINLGPKS